MVKANESFLIELPYILFCGNSPALTWADGDKVRWYLMYIILKEQRKDKYEIFFSLWITLV